MAKRAFVVTGLGYGDECKGTTVDWLSLLYRAHTVFRYGGAQAFHRVVRKNGEEHIFSQFGSGTLRGAATHLSKHMVIDPDAILKEGNVLVYEHGIRSAFTSMTIHEDALVITPFQAITGRLRELMRGKNRLGSVGIGIGETVLDAETFGEDSIRARDLSRPDLREKLKAVQQRKFAELEALADRASIIPRDVQESVRSELALLANPDTVQWAVERFAELARRVRIVDTEYVATRILGVDGTVIMESSQGVLLDRWHGFHPYTTKVRVVPEVARGILNECGYDGEITSLGVLRAYHTRHGNGPFVTESAELTKQLQDASNKTHAWQGDFRVGHFDAVAAKYAVEACGEQSIDGLVVTCLDRIAPFGRWQVCETYDASREALTADTFFRRNGTRIEGIAARTESGVGEQTARQEMLGRFLGQCSPRLTSLDFSSQKNLIETCTSTLQAITGIPVVAVSIGPTEADKLEIKKQAVNSG